MPRPNPYGWQNIQPGAPVTPGASAPIGVRPGSRRWRRLVMAGLLVGGLSGLLVLLYLYLSWSEYPNLVVVAPRASTLAVPDNSGGVATAQELAEFCKAGKNRPRLNAAPLTDPKDRDGWKKHLGSARGGGLAVYFAASGSADADGPFLWWPPTEPLAALTDADRLKVTDILAELKAHGGPKLLVFDLTPGALPWAANGASCDFAAALKELDSQIAAVPGLAVVCSADAGETAWHWDAAGASVFGHHFARAIQGEGRDANAVVSADGAFETTKLAVNNWSRKQRAATQTPVLLPAGDEGNKRAKAMSLSKVPPGGYTAPPRPTAPAQNRSGLEAEWAAAETELPHPERLDPEGFKLYLGWRLRWEQLVRDNLPVGALPTTVADQRTRLARTAEQDVPLVTLAVPQPLANPPPLAIEPLWKAADADKLRAEWKRQTLDNPRPEHARLASLLLLGKLDAAGYSRANLQTAVRLLDVFEAGLGQRPVETHLVRMLARHLDPLTPPTDAAVKSALAVRRTAELAAWAGLIDGHGEVAFRWTGARLRDADRQRRRAEDLLFSGDPKAHAEAGQLLTAAGTQYAELQREAGTLAAALAARSRVLVRLPFYARWVAGAHRAKRVYDLPTALRQVETAFRLAHALEKTLTEAPPADATQRAAALTQLATAAREANEAFEQVVTFYEAEVTELLTAAETQPENWHALDAASAVPFLTAERRSKLFDKLERVTRGLDSPGDPLGTTPTPVAGNAVAARHVAVARELLGGMASDVPPTDGNNPAALRAASDQIGKTFRRFPEAAKAEMATVGEAKPLALAEQPLASAARRTRLADPSAPVAAAVDPVVADRRYWRHRFLLWQSERAIADGWANVGAVTPIVTARQPVNRNEWYATKTAGVLAEKATAAVLGLVIAPTQEQRTRFTEDCVAAANRRPSAVQPEGVAAYTVIADYPGWTFGFKVHESPEVADAKPPAGHPALWVELPDDYRPANVEAVSTREAYRGGGHSRDWQYFTPKLAPTDPKPLVSVAFHRGHLAKWTTTVAFSGDPILEYTHAPPTGQGRLAVVADEKVLGGAVVFLIDRSASMRWDAQNAERKPTRTSLALAGLKKLLDALPMGTSVTVGGFHRDGDKPDVVAIAGPKLMDEQNRWDALGLTEEKLAAIPRAETPIAWSVERVLDREAGKTFWPTNFVGGRSVVVLTDGADNFSADPKETIRAAVNGDPQDTRVHLVFFAMDDGDEQKADTQFTALKKPELYEAGKLPVTLWQKVKDGDAFAEKLKSEFRPRVVYTRVGDANARPRSITATPKGTGTGNSEPSPLLDHGEYQFKSGTWKGQVSLSPGDQLILKVIRGKTLGYELTVPLTAYATTPAPLRSPGTDEKAFRLAVPRVAWNDRSAELTVAFERPAVEARAGLRMNRPLFPWLDATDPAKPGTLRRMLVENDPSLVAPAWSVRFPGWDSGADQTVTAVKMPALTGFWIDEAALKVVRPKSAGKFRARGVLEVPSEPVPGITARRVRTDAGPLLVLEVDYQQPGLFPYLLTGWPGDAPTQRHRYYDPQHRYTATFGPLTAGQEDLEIGFQLYEVADLRKAAEAATVELPAMKTSEKSKDATPNLRFGQPK